METNERKELQTVARYWWLLLVTGIMLAGLGVWVFATPVAAYLSLSIFFAVGMVLTGIFEVLFALSNSRFISGWGWILVGGLVDLIMGIYLLYFPMLSLIVMPILMGLWMLFRGFMAIGSSIEFRNSASQVWRWLLVAGVLIIIFALLILGDPLFGVINIVIWTGLSLIAAGISRILIAIKLRSIRNEFE